MTHDAAGDRCAAGFSVRHMIVARKIFASLPKPDICALMIDALTKTDRLHTAYAESREAAMAAFATKSWRRERRHALPPALLPITVRGDVSWHPRARREDINGLEDSQGEPASRRRKRDFLASWVCRADRFDRCERYRIVVLCRNSDQRGCAGALDNDLFK